MMNECDPKQALHLCTYWQSLFEIKTMFTFTIERWVIITGHGEKPQLGIHQRPYTSTVQVYEGKVYCI